MIGLEEKIKLLNHEQKEIFDRVTMFVRHQNWCKKKDCNCPLRGSDFKAPIREFITGVGGTGMFYD